MPKDIIEKCVGCARVMSQQVFFAGEDFRYCSRYIDPAAQWRRGNCPLATHIKKDLPGEEKKLNPLKASKRSVK